MCFICDWKLNITIPVKISLQNVFIFRQNIFFTFSSFWKNQGKKLKCSPPQIWRNSTKIVREGGRPSPDIFSDGVLKLSSGSENVFGKTFANFGFGPEIFRPPRTRNPNFQPQKFLWYTILGLKLAFLDFYGPTVPWNVVSIIKTF